jgi:hypothetical protein
MRAEGARNLYFCIAFAIQKREIGVAEAKK